MIAVKPGASLDGIKAEMVVALEIISTVFAERGFDTIITEGTGASHMPNSLHYKGLALDIRSKQILDDNVKYEVLYECQKRLTHQYDMILESPNTDNEHFHIEFDPE